MIQIMMDGEDDALKPILQLARDCMGGNANTSLPTIRTVVLKALSDPKVFCGFDELKSVFQDRLAKAGDEGAVLLRTLDLFSYGTYEDYVAQQGQQQLFVTLSDTQVTKLRQLSLLTLVHQTCAYGNSNTGSSNSFVIPYATVAVELGIVSNTNANTANNNTTVLDESVVRQVETLVLDCVYARVLTGRLCQKTRALFVTSRTGPPCRARDVPLGQRGMQLLQILQQFHDTVAQASTLTCTTNEQLQMEFDANRNYYNGILDRARKAESNSTSGGGGGGNMNNMMNHNNNPILIAAGGVLGWGDEQRRGSLTEGGGLRGSASSTSQQRQTKRSRGGVGGSVMEAFRY